MKDALRILQPWIGKWLLTMYALHDLSFLIVAVVGAFAIPPSVEQTLAVYAWFWVVTVGVGSLCGFAGTVLRNVRLEVLGCGFMISGLVIYAAALLVRIATSGSLTGVAAVGIFLAASFSLGARIVVMFAAIYLREPK